MGSALSALRGAHPFHSQPHGQAGHGKGAGVCRAPAPAQGRRSVTTKQQGAAAGGPEPQQRGHSCRVFILLVSHLCRQKGPRWKRL